MIRTHTMEPAPAKIMRAVDEAPGVKTFTVKYASPALQKKFHFIPGEFIEVSVFGHGEMAISITGNPHKKSEIELAVSNVGRASSAMHKLKEGDIIGLRGPFGNGFPMPAFNGKNIVFVSGGCGLPPMRACLLYALGRKGEFGSLHFFYGARSPENFVFKKDLKEWEKNPAVNLFLSVDSADKSWKGNVGVVTKLLVKKNLPEPRNSVAVMCGPPIMEFHTAKTLREMGFGEENIFLSLERRMHCGIGKCEHCNIGGKHVCIDGPVFSLKALREMNAEEVRWK